MYQRCNECAHWQQIGGGKGQCRRKRFSVGESLGMLVTRKFDGCNGWEVRIVWEGTQYKTLVDAYRALGSAYRVSVEGGIRYQTVIGVLQDSGIDLAEEQRKRRMRRVRKRRVRGKRNMRRYLTWRKIRTLRCAGVTSHAEIAAKLDVPEKEVKRITTIYLQKRIARCRRRTEREQRNKKVLHMPKLVEVRQDTAGYLSSDGWAGAAE